MLDTHFYPGGDNNIAVVMGVFEPKIQCRGNFDTSLSCKDILAEMPATTELEVFGPHDTPFVKEILPQEVASGKAPPECWTGSHPS